MKRLKPLILIVLTVVVVEAQAQTPVNPTRLADFARQERERRARNPLGGQVYTSEEAKRGTTGNMAVTSPAGPPREASRTSKTEIFLPIPKGGKVVEPAAVEPTNDWNAKVAEQRAKVRELQDQHDALQLQVSQIQNQYLAPVTDSNAKQVALNKMLETQKKLDDTDVELTSAQSKLRELEGQGPPKK
jgi:hypothetical protein